MAGPLEGGAWGSPITRDVVWIEGPDAVTFLQGQLSQDVEAIEIGASAPTLLLSPKGKVESWGNIARMASDRFAFVVAAGWGASTVARLERFLLRTDAQISVDEDISGFAVRTVGDEPSPVDGGALVVVQSGWPGFAGVDLIGIDDLPSTVVAADENAYEVARILAGVPMLGSELDGSVIPGEAGAPFVEASVSFTKGCYVGQELVARVHSRGDNTPRKLRRVSIDGPPPPVGSEITIDGDVVGELTSVVALADDASFALGFVKRSAVDVVEVEVATESGPVSARLSIV